MREQAFSVVTVAEAVQALRIVQNSRGQSRADTLGCEMEAFRLIGTVLDDVNFERLCSSAARSATTGDGLRQCRIRHHNCALVGC